MKKYNEFQLSLKQMDEFYNDDGDRYTAKEFYVLSEHEVYSTAKEAVKVAQSGESILVLNKEYNGGMLLSDCVAPNILKSNKNSKK